MNAVLGSDNLGQPTQSPQLKHLFIPGEKISSEFELDSNDSVDSVGEQGEEDDDGEWNMRGAALERDFLGMDDDSVED